MGLNEFAGYFAVAITALASGYIAAAYGLRPAPLYLGIGIAAACVVAPLCDHVDLDGNLLLAEDPCPGVIFADGVQVPSEEPGLGVG